MASIPFSVPLLRHDFGATSKLTQPTLARLVALLSDDVGEFTTWRNHYLSGLPERKQAVPDATLRQIFATQTYYALILQTLAAQRLFPQPAINPLENDFFESAGIHNGINIPEYAWYARFWDVLAPYLQRIKNTIARYELTQPPPDALKVLYQDLFKRQWRHTAGEYFTPDWLANFTLDQLGYTGDGRLLDPACGTGTFLILALHRLLHKMPAADALQHLWGIDINPLAVLSAQVNLILAIGAPSQPIMLPVSWANAILSPPEIGTFDVIAGNPPWVNQETLSEAYRLALTQMWEKYDLFVQKGMESILGGGKKDLAMLMTYAAADIYLRDGGKLGFILPAGLFKSGGAGAGFRRFATHTMPLKVLAVDDVSALNPFPEVGSGSAVLVLQKGAKTTYPVTYRVWRPHPPTPSPKNGEGEVYGQINLKSANYISLIATPINPADLTSAWLTGMPNVLHAIRKMTGSSDYVAHAGVYTGGANGVYWLEILEALPNDLVRVRNMTAGAKRSVPQVEAILETKFVYPLLRGQDVRRWDAAPTAAILLVQHPQQRRGYAEHWLKTHYPLTHAYLCQFESLLRTRATFKRYFEPDAPFYTMFDIGDYSFAPVKVVWQGMGKVTMQAAVITQAAIAAHDSAKPIMPNQAMHPFIPLQNEDEAHYLAACLNSVPFMLAVRSHTQPGGKSFAQPGILKVLRLPRYNARKSLHRQLVQLSRCAHAGQLDTEDHTVLAAQVWDLSVAELAAVLEAWATL
jgi:methylase of polypeptide subunit release factors